MFCPFVRRQITDFVQHLVCMYYLAVCVAGRLVDYSDPSHNHLPLGSPRQNSGTVPRRLSIIKWYEVRTHFFGTKLYTLLRRNWIFPCTRRIQNDGYVRVVLPWIRDTIVRGQISVLYMLPLWEARTETVQASHPTSEVSGFATHTSTGANTTPVQ